MIPKERLKCLLTASTAAKFTLSTLAISASQLRWIYAFKRLEGKKQINSGVCRCGEGVIFISSSAQETVD